MVESYRKDKAEGQSSNSLEKVTVNTPGLNRRAFLTGALAILAGCSAPGARSLLERDEPYANEMAKHDHGDVENFAKENLQDIMKATKVEPYKTPAPLRNSAKNHFAASRDEVTWNAFSEMEKQNQYLSELFDAAKIRRYNLRSAKRNADYDGLEMYASMPQKDAERLEKVLTDLNVSIRQLGFDKRQKLEKAFGKNKQFQEMAKYNKDSLEVLNKLFISSADIETLEGNLKNVVDANAYSSEIIKSLTGLDHSDEENGRGKRLLDKLLNEHNFGDIVSPDTHVADAYSDYEKKKIREVYDDLLSKIGKEAKDWDAEESLHTVCNDYLGKMLEITKEAYVHGKFGRGNVANEQFQAVNRVVTKQALDKVRDNLETKRGLSLFYDVGVSIIPGYSLVSAIANANRALSADTWAPEAQDPAAAHAEMLRKGKNIKYGFATRDFIAGSNYTARVRFYSGVLSTAAQIGAGVLLWKLGAKDKDSSSAGASQVEIYGGETGSPGIGPR